MTISLCLIEPKRRNAKMLLNFAMGLFRSDPTPSEIKSFFQKNYLKELLKEVPDSPIKVASGMIIGKLGTL